MEFLYPSKKKLRNSGLIFSAIFAVLFIMVPYLKGEHIHALIWFFTLSISSLSICSPSKLRLPYIYWIKLGNKLSKINLLVILTLIFYVIITPLSIIRRLIKLILRPKKNNSSFYKRCEKNPPCNFNEQL